MLKKRYFYTSIFCFIFSSTFTTANIYADSSILGYKEGELLVKFAPKKDGKQKNLSEKNGTVKAFKASI